MTIGYALDGIPVNVIAPGTIETPLLDRLSGSEEGKNLEEPTNGLIQWDV